MVTKTLKIIFLSFLVLLIIPNRAYSLSIDCTNSDKQEPSFTQYAQQSDAIIIKGKIVEVDILNDSKDVLTDRPHMVNAVVEVEKYWGSFPVNGRVEVLGPKDPWGTDDSTGYFRQGDRYFMILKRSADGRYQLYNRTIYCKNNSIINLRTTDLSEVELEAQLNQLTFLPMFYLFLGGLSAVVLFVGVGIYAKTHINSPDPTGNRTPIA